MIVKLFGFNLVVCPIFIIFAKIGCIMKLLDFYKIPYGETCENHFRMLQVEEDVTCNKCGCSCLSWDKSRKYWCSAKWGRQTTLESIKNESLEVIPRTGSQLWILMAATRKIFSALEM